MAAPGQLSGGGANGEANGAANGAAGEASSLLRLLYGAHGPEGAAELGLGAGQAVAQYHGPTAPTGACMLRAGRYKLIEYGAIHVVDADGCMLGYADSVTRLPYKKPCKSVASMGTAPTRIRLRSSVTANETSIASARSRSRRRAPRRAPPATWRWPCGRASAAP